MVDGRNSLSGSSVDLPQPVGRPCQEEPGEFGDGGPPHASVAGVRPQNVDSASRGEEATGEVLPAQIFFSRQPPKGPWKARKPPKIKKNTRATLTVASLNVRGRGNSIPLHPGNKWASVHQMVKEKKIGVLAVQEAHLTPQLVDALHGQYGRRLVIHCSPNPTDPNTDGVAFVLNKDVTNVEGALVNEIVPGRALLLCLPWHADLTLTVLNVYAPNAPHENKCFWKGLREQWDTGCWPQVDMLVGDFNVVEEALDRQPCHEDNGQAVTALGSLKRSLGLEDGWRSAYPATIAFSFFQSSSGSFSRLDHIYISPTLKSSALDWAISDTPVVTDHKALLVKIANLKAPYIGLGRWTMPLFLLKDKSFMDGVYKLGKVLELRVAHPEAGGLPVGSSQVQFKEFKDSVVTLARGRAHVAVPAMEAKIRLLELKLHNLLNSATLDEDEEVRLAAAKLQGEICELTRKQHLNARTASTAHYRLEGETVSKYWSQMNRPKSPRDPVYALRIPGSSPASYVVRSDQMASITCDYHARLQEVDMETNAQERENVTRRMLSNLPKLREGTDNDHLGTVLAEGDVILALRHSKNGSATRLNRIPYEFWKALADSAENDKKSGRRAPFDVIKVLTLVYNDIEKRGVVNGSAFADGWMCPVYKKGDQREISNYRPITLLNSDYKLLTKALSMKLASAVPSLVHRDQAGASLTRLSWQG